MSTMYPSLMADMIGVDLLPDGEVELASRHGFVGIDLRLTRRLGWLEQYGVERFANHMAAHKIRAGYGSMLTRTLSANPEEWSHAMEQLPRVAAVARGLGFTRAGVVVMPFDDGLDPAANRKRHLLRLREAAPILADHGVRLGLEYVSPETRRAGAAFPFVYAMQAMRELIHAAGQPNVGLMLDCFHWHCAGESVDDIRALTADDVVVVHVNDAPSGVALDRLDVRDRALPGSTGVIDLLGFMQALRAIGYEGPVTAEPTHPRWVGLTSEDAAVATGVAVNATVRLAGY